MFKLLTVIKIIFLSLKFQYKRLTLSSCLLRSVYLMENTILLCDGEKSTVSRLDILGLNLERLWKKSRKRQIRSKVFWLQKTDISVRGILDPRELNNEIKQEREETDTEQSLFIKVN